MGKISNGTPFWLFVALLYYDLTSEQIEGFDGQTWDLCATTNDERCFVKRRVLSSWLSGHKDTGRTDSFLHR